MSEEMIDQACQTPLVELLERVPDDARMTYEHSPTHHQMIPVGRLCHEAAASLRLSAWRAVPALVQDAYEEGVEDGIDCPVPMPQWIDSVARVELLRAMSAYNPNERLREALERVAELEKRLLLTAQIIQSSDGDEELITMAYRTASGL